MTIDPRVLDYNMIKLDYNEKFYLKTIMYLIREVFVLAHFKF